MTGPEFGAFQITLDSEVINTYNASSTVETYDTLLWFVTGLTGSAEHMVMITNMDDGMMLALDYFISVQSDEDGVTVGSASETGNWSGMSPTTMTTLASSTTTAIPRNGPGNEGGSGNETGAVVGGILGTLAGLVGVNHFH